MESSAKLAGSSKSQV